MADDKFSEQIQLLRRMTGGAWTTLWLAVDTKDMIVALRVCDEELQIEAMTHIPPGLEEPDIPQRISFEEARGALSNVCQIARVLVDEDNSQQ